jgi:hypothetical protein
LRQKAAPTVRFEDATKKGCFKKEELQWKSTTSGAAVRRAETYPYSEVSDITHITLRDKRQKGQLIKSVGLSAFYLTTD